MWNIKFPVELADPAKYDILLPDSETFFKPLHTPEPYQIHDARFIAESAHEAFSLAFAQGFETTERTAQLHHFTFIVHLLDAVEFGAVYVPEGKMEQQVAAGKDAQLGFESLCSLWAYAFQEFYVGI